MKHLGTQRIETTRLTLRRFVESDAEAMFRNWASDPEVTKYLTWPAHGSMEVSQQVMNDWISHYEEDTFYQWAIVPKDLGEPIGTISVVSRNDRAELVQLGYCIGKNWWHRGIMSETLQAVLDFFFEEVGVNRVEAIHDVKNPNSGAVMKKCGMKYEATLRQSGWNNSGICDMAWYALLKEDRR